MTRYEFYNNLELFNKSKEITEQEEKDKVQTELNELKHYGTLGQKWGVRKWQNPDGTFNEAGKERYFGKNGTTKKNTEDEVGSIYSTGQKIKNLFPQKRVNENGEEYDARYQNHYGYLTEKGKKYLERHPHDATGKLNMKLYAESLRRGAENDAEREKERLAREAKQKSDNEYINNLKSNIKTTKELKGEEISDKEFKDIIRELDNFDMRDFERNHKEDYNKVADIGIDALNRAEGGWVEDDIRDDGNREWFMWEDQTIGNPEIAYLYYKGYSKDYIKQYLNKNIPYEDEEKYSDDEYSKGFFVKDEFHRGGDAYIDALFDKGEEDQKIGSSPDSKKIFENKTDADYMDKDGNFDDNKYWKDKEKAEKYLDENYDRDFAETVKEAYDTTGEWGDVDKQYEEYKKDPLNYLRKYSPDPKYRKLTDKDIKKATKEAKNLEKELENAKYQDKQKIINDLINDDKYKDTIDEAIKPYVEKNKKNIDRVNEIFKDYEDDEINTLANAGIANSLMNKWGDKNNNETMKELAGYAHYYLNDDGNQGDNTAEYLYATIDKGVKAKELGNLWDNLRYSNEEKNENIPSLKKDPFLSNLSDDTLKEIVTNKFESKFNKSSYWNLYNASDTASDPDDTVKKAYGEAKNISKKLEKSCGNTNGWDYFWKAVDNLNMGDMNYKDLSQADWDRINAEINKLKK